MVLSYLANLAKILIPTPQMQHMSVIMMLPVGIKVGSLKWGGNDAWLYYPVLH